MTSLDELRPVEFAPRGVFLNSATLGLAPRRSTDALLAFEEARRAGTVVTVPCPDDIGDRLAAADMQAAVRAGRLCLSFRLYNDESDVDAALRALA